MLMSTGNANSTFFLVFMDNGYVPLKTLFFLKCYLCIQKNKIAKTA